MFEGSHHMFSGEMLSVMQATQFMGNMVVWDLNSFRCLSCTAWDLGESIFQIQQQFKNSSFLMSFFYLQREWALFKGVGHVSIVAHEWTNQTLTSQSSFFCIFASFKATFFSYMFEIKGVSLVQSATPLLDSTKSNTLDLEGINLQIHCISAAGNKSDQRPKTNNVSLSGIVSLKFLISAEHIHF